MTSRADRRAGEVESTHVDVERSVRNRLYGERSDVRAVRVASTAVPAEAPVPFLGERYPELTPTLDRLSLEHQKIAVLLDELQEIIADDNADPLLVLSEVERLADELERHLSFERRSS